MEWGWIELGLVGQFLLKREEKQCHAQFSYILTPRLTGHSLSGNFLGTDARKARGKTPMRATCILEYTCRHYVVFNVLARFYSV